MKIQSLSIVVPPEPCVNNCKFCVSRTHHENYEGEFSNEQYLRRMAFARDNGCNTVMLTGTNEPQQNMPFLKNFGMLNRQLDKPFRWVEMQTAGVYLTEEMLDDLYEMVGVSTISLSLSSLIPNKNIEYNGITDKNFNISKLCKSIKERGFNLRLSLNMTDAMEIDPSTTFTIAQTLEADQVTFRVLYKGENDCPQNRWITEHAMPRAIIDEYNNYVKVNGRKLEVLEFGQIRYDVNGISVVVDDDCMSTVPKEELKYLVLRPNCKLYSKWDSKASLLF